MDHATTRREHTRTHTRTHTHPYSARQRLCDAVSASLGALNPPLGNRAAVPSWLSHTYSLSHSLAHTHTATLSLPITIADSRSQGARLITTAPFPQASFRHLPAHSLAGPPDGAPRPAPRVPRVEYHKSARARKERARAYLAAYTSYLAAYLPWPEWGVTVGRGGPMVRRWGTALPL